MKVLKIYSTDKNFYKVLDKRLNRLEKGFFIKEYATAVTKILNGMKGGRTKANNALLKYTRLHDERVVNSLDELEVKENELREALAGIDQQQRDALEMAAERIRRYHEQQLKKSPQTWDLDPESDGTVLGQRTTPLDRVGIYVPGGKAAYPSTVLMTAIPAMVAGVTEIIMVTPAKGGTPNKMVLAAAAIAGVKRVFTVGGAQAVGALAYGKTSIIPKVDKIVGPGNIFVAMAKRETFGTVAIDMIAGPSEILIICDGKVKPEWIAMDLLSQAEHDEMAQSILISDNESFLDAVEQEINKILEGNFDRKNIAIESIETRGVLILVKDLDEAAEISNHIAPEHLELAVEDPQALLPKIKHAGAIFLGKYTSEALGDYVAGPSHVLPTSGTARFSSPLGVYDFQKRSSIIQCSPESASTLGKVASVLARSESLTAHARSAEARIKN